MAAYAALVSLMNDLELTQTHPTHSFSFDSKQISSLSQTVETLIHFMETYDSHGRTKQAAEVLQRRIASAAHAVHDVIESHIVDQILAGSTLGKKSRCYFLLDLQKAIDNMNMVKRKAMQLREKSGLKEAKPTSYSPPTSSEAPGSTKNLMVGFDAVLLRLIEMIAAESSNRRLIPIVGMGGLGKTTLTKNAYDHLLIQHRFDVRLWATISQEYNVETILKQLLSENRESINGGNVGELGEKLHKMLWGRRYLVVLDDTWSVEAWDEIALFLPDNGNGSRVIVTTRLSNLAAHLSSSPLDLNFLDDDKSWELFCRKAFGEEGDCPVELEEIGKKIVKRCRGLPLSIVVMGGHFRRSSRAIEYWENVASYMNPISSLGVEDQCLNIINLSYEHLPVCLKPCFLYMGIYEEDKEIDVSELLMLWVAEGFLRQYGYGYGYGYGSMSLEEVAEDYLKDLIDRNLVLVRERRWNGKAEVLGIHDVVRELCLKVAKKEKFLSMLEDTTQDMERRIVISKGMFDSDMVGDLESMPFLRSVICQGLGHVGRLFGKLRTLRVSAYVENVMLKKDCRDAIDAYFQQVNLRHLAMIVSRIFTIRKRLRVDVPWSISLLWSMQTLILNNIGLQLTLPHEIWAMPQLRHLRFIGSCLLPEPLPSDGVLGNLRTLVGVVNLRLTEEVCKRMPNLRELSVAYDEDGHETCTYYCLHNLSRFSKLESFVCCFGDDSKWRDVALSFIFPTSLEKLCLWNCRLHWEDLAMLIKSSPRLGSLALSSVHGLEWDLEDQEFPCLKELRVLSCYDLVHWNGNDFHFPALEILYLSFVRELSEIPIDIGDIPTLRLIELDNCNVSVAVSAMRIVVEQESLGNHGLQLDVYFREVDEFQRFQKILEEEGLTSNSLRLYNGYGNRKESL